MPVATRAGPLVPVTSEPPTLAPGNGLVEREPLVRRRPRCACTSASGGARLGLHDEVAGRVVEHPVHAGRGRARGRRAPAAGPRSSWCRGRGPRRPGRGRRPRAAPRPPPRSRSARATAAGGRRRRRRRSGVATASQAEATACRARLVELPRRSRDRRHQKTSARPASCQRVRALVPARDLTAQPRRREDLAGVGDPVGVEGAADQLHGVEVVVGEHPRHVGRLVDADPVLAGDRPAVADAEVEDRAADLLGRLAGARRSASSKSTSGCRLPSPAWKTLATRTPDDSESSAIARSTSGSAVRGITPSWTM